MINFKLDKAKLEQIMKLPMKAAVKAFGYTAQEVWGLLKKESPVDHGRLAGSWQLSKEGDFRYKAKSEVKGMKPNPYPDRAMKGAEKRIPEFVARALREVDTGAK